MLQITGSFAIGTHFCFIECDPKVASRENPLVSVVIPCYNHAHFLAEAIESVLAQKYPHVELLVVDDGSTDDTAAIASRYPAVRYIRQNNRGLAGARNTGWRASKGDFLAFLDADDFFLPGALEAGARALIARPELAFVSGDYQYVNADGSVRDRFPQRFVQHDHYQALLRGNYIGMHATVMYRREPLEEAGGFNPALPACEDYDLYLRIARRHRIGCHQELVAAYRQHGTNMSGDTELMLGTVLGVLRAQRRYAGVDRAHRRALAEGIAGWQSFYGEALVNEIMRRRHAGDRQRATRALTILLRHAPAYAARSVYRTAARTVLRVVRRALRTVTPGPLRRLVRSRHDSPFVGRVRFGDLRRLTPISRQFGFDRGLPIDRHYIESFLHRNRRDIQGRVLEVGDDAYTRRFGSNRVTIRDVLHIDDSNRLATFVGDLTVADHIPSDAFDCIVLTQTLHLIYDVRAAVRTLHRMLKPGGVLLATVPGISQLSDDQWADSWHWAFTERSTRRLFAEVFPEERIETEVQGNVLAAMAFLQGLAASELRREELDHRDLRYQLIITLRAEKPATLP
jgi:glycosyltransferase involved in cell wall biosynthesis